MNAQKPVTFSKIINLVWCIKAEFQKVKNNLAMANGFKLVDSLSEAVFYRFQNLENEKNNMKKC